jgi:Flp pilus assembly protein TadB
MLLVAIGIHGAISPVIAVVALAGLVACGNLLYGKNSHGATAAARVRPAQEAQNRAIEEAQLRARQEREQGRRQREEVRRQNRQSRQSRQHRPNPSPQPRQGGQQQSTEGPG